MAKKNITISDLAGMVKRGFDGNDKRFNDMDRRFDRIENILIKQHSEEIENLKKRMHRLEEALAINK